MTLAGSPGLPDVTDLFGAKDSLQVDSVIAHLSVDGFIAYPTETVWGLGACAGRPAGIEGLVSWKGRSGNAPMTKSPTPLQAASGTSKSPG